MSDPETKGLIMASAAVIRGLPRERYVAWAQAEGVAGLTVNEAVDLYDYVENMLEVDYRDE